MTYFEYLSNVLKVQDGQIWTIKDISKSLSDYIEQYLKPDLEEIRNKAWMYDECSK